MVICTITVLPLEIINNNINLIYENNTIYMMYNNTKKYLFDTNNVKSFYFEQNKFNYRFYFDINEHSELKNKMILIESSNAALIDLIVKNVPNINLTRSTIPYWTILTTRYSKYYNSYVFNLAIFLIALINVMTLIYNLVFPYINTIHVVKFLERYNIIKYFDALSNLYIYVLITEFINLFKKIKDLFPKGTNTEDSKLCKKFYDLGKFFWSFLTSDYYRMQYKKRYLYFAIFVALSVYILYINI